MRPAPLMLATALLASVFIPPHALNASGTPPDPFSEAATVRVLLFVRTDCPITNRYAPELQRIAAEFARDSVKFWLVYPDRTETPASVQHHLEDYHLPGTPLLHPDRSLVLRAHATVAPEAAVFDRSGRLCYHGRIDNRYIAPGKSRPAATVHDLEDAIGATLQGRPVKEAETRAVGCALADIE